MVPVTHSMSILFSFCIFTGCLIRDIVIKIMETQPHLKEENLLVIMRYLGTSAWKRDQILKKITNGHSQTYDALEDILQDWLLRRSHEATVEKFLEYLKKCELNSYADAIAKEFKQQNLINTGKI